MRLGNLVSYLFPQQVTLSHRERLLSGAAGCLAIFLTTWIAYTTIGTTVFPFLLASMGASAVLLLGAPHSPLSQPWSFVGGHLISGAIGITCAHHIPSLYLSAGLAVGLAIVAMYYLRCLHPPGGATALLAVVGDQRIHALGYHLLIAPVLLNIVALLALALLINRLVPGRQYPVNLSLPAAGTPTPIRQATVKLGFSENDLLAALRDMDGYIDVTSEDLERIYSLATLHAQQRRLNRLCLENIMTREVVTIAAHASLESLWSTLRECRIRGVPVVDAAGRVVGVASIADFMKQADWRMRTGFVERIKALWARLPPSTVDQVMSSPAITASAVMPMIEAFRIFAEHGINHLPVVDAQQRPIGIVTRLDLLAALYGDMGEAAAS